MAWQYLAVRVVVIPGGGISGVQINGEKVTTWDRKKLHELLAHLGEQNWELVFIDKIPEQMMIFKRQA